MIHVGMKTDHQHGQHVNQSKYSSSYYNALNLNRTTHFRMAALVHKMELHLNASVRQAPMVLYAHPHIILVHRTRVEMVELVFVFSILIITTALARRHSPETYVRTKEVNAVAY